jgi:predicted AAA+ superfamily ATPase
MKRHAIKELIQWKSSINRKPLIIRGARQVGKTWLMQEFGRTQYARVAYINMDNNQRMAALFSGNLDIKRIIMALQIESGVTIDALDTLIIFDEIQEVPHALGALKYFYEDAPQYHVVAAGSLLGVALHPGTSFPVGKVDFLDLHPLDFLEFAAALGKNDLVELLLQRDFNLVKSFKGLYVDLLKDYCYCGGMPEAVVTLIDTRDYNRVRQVQNRLLEAYEQDFSKHAPNETVPRIRMLWKSLPVQLARENRKFVYGLVRQGARARDYELAMTWLIDCGLVYKIGRISKPGIPLAAYQDLNAFKLFLLDTGLLGAMSGLDAKTLFDGNKAFEEFKGALTEQYVLQQLVAANSTLPFYWSTDSATAEIDFVFQSGADIVPLEVKAAENLKAKSLKSYRQKYAPAFSIRASMSDYRQDEELINLPLYAVNVLGDILHDAQALRKPQ